MDTDPVSEISDTSGRMWGEVVVDRFNISSYNHRKGSDKKKHTFQWKESAGNDAEILSRRARLAHRISKTLDMEPSSYAQDASQGTESSISNGREKKMSSFNNNQKDTFPVYNHSKGDCIWNAECGELSEGASSYQTSLPNSELSHANRTKAEVKAISYISRVCSTQGTEVAVVADDDESFKCSEDRVQRRTYDLTGKAPVYSLQEGASDFKKGICNWLSDQSGEIETGCRHNVKHVYDSQELAASHHISSSSALETPSVPQSENLTCQRRQKLMKGKRKRNSIPSNYNNYSSSTVDDSETQSRALRCRILPKQSCIAPDGSSTGTRQVELDEIFARRLQNQFHNELLSSKGTQEVDAAIAHQDDAHQSFFMARRPQFNNRDAPMAHLHAYYAQLPQSTNHACTPTSSSRRDFYGSQMDYETRMMAEIRRNFSSGTMGREMRHNLLEALEATFDYSNDLFYENALQARGDFNENDYEMLLAFDENHHQHVGASESQINSLPQATIHGDNIEEACVICLETPSLGDVIRLLPCLHKFHKECIDTWLRRRSSCPVCKSNI